MIWALGDYLSVSRFLTSAGEACVRDARIGPGDDVLDVACGTGNATLPAARTGARVTGLDITPELLEIAAREANGLNVRWVEGDVEALPFPDASFDAVLSVFGCMFAPRHEAAARELRRVLRPGGRLVVSSWTPEGTVGHFFATVGGYVEGNGDPPILWGTEEHVRSLLGDASFTRGVVRFEFASVEDAVEFYATSFGPLISARLAIGERWDELREDLLALFTEHDVSDGDGFVYEGEYLTARLVG